MINHVCFWQEYALLRLQGKTPDRAALGSEQGWPGVLDPADEHAWAEARQRALEINRELAHLVASFSEQDISQPYAPAKASRAQVILGVIAHNSYHACEAISIRHMLGFWVQGA